MIATLALRKKNEKKVYIQERLHKIRNISLFVVQKFIARRNHKGSTIFYAYEGMAIINFPYIIT